MNESFQEIQQEIENLQAPSVLWITPATRDFWESLDRDLSALGYGVIYIDQETIITNKESLLNAFFTAGEFPVYFGNNYDALADCLSDMSWKPSRAYVILFREPVHLAKFDKSVVEMLINIVGDVSLLWRQHSNTPFKLVASKIDD